MSGISNWGDCIVEMSTINDDGVQKTLGAASGLCTIALIIIAGLGAAGHLFMTGQITGICTLVFSIPALIMTVIYTIRANHRIATALNLPGIINFIATTIIGSLTIANVMGAFPAGVTVLSSSLIVIALNCGISCTIGCATGKEVVADTAKDPEAANAKWTGIAQQVNNKRTGKA